MCVCVRAHMCQILFNLVLFRQNFTFIPLGIKNPSLDPELGVVGEGAAVTRLGAIGHGAEVGSQGWCGW
jgi:hypothetical protein